MDTATIGDGLFLVRVIRPCPGLLLAFHDEKEHLTRAMDKQTLEYSQASLLVRYAYIPYFSTQVDSILPDEHLAFFQLVASQLPKFTFPSAPQPRIIPNFLSKCSHVKFCM